ncbi:MAG: IPT/TIG domain-containing protein [Aurantibacter sp.]
MDLAGEKSRRVIKFKRSKLLSATTYLMALLAATLFLFIGISCSKDNTPVPEPDSILVPILSGISPESGPKNTVVTIFGNHFGTDASEVQVFFNDTEVEVQTVSETQIKTVVPVGTTTGLIKLNVKGIAITGPEFTYILSLQVSTLAGSTQDFADGNGASAKFSLPAGAGMDMEGNLYVADFDNHKIRKITSAGDVSTLAGSTQGFADGTGPSAQFSFPYGVAVDASGNVYVADAGNHKIRKITPVGEVGTLAGSTQGFSDGMGMSAQFNGPFGLAVDPEGVLYVADFQNHKIRKITPEGMVYTLAGGTQGYADGLGMSAQFAGPSAIVVDDDDGNVYVADTANHKIRKITANGMVSTLAGSIQGFEDGEGIAARFDLPAGLARDASGNIYVADSQNHKLRKISPDGVVSTLAGSTQGFSDGIAQTAQFNFPFGVGVDDQGILYVADNGNHRIRKIVLE